ncbi:hypothetical protein B0H16DRAFT_1714382 [Mycena metata]|uniref:Uncharacterized protein n=1 Tax=Mycena metata TaxID=1033252 RepID=A0AAD7JUX7_9AGAR|nr:hypothetical protein B0H16DRAFT_1714382 [Mycena metata]
MRGAGAGPELRACSEPPPSSLPRLQFITPKALLVFVVAAGCGIESVFAATQPEVPFRAPTDTDRSNFVNSPVESESQFYHFKWPIRKVAIISAGVKSPTANSSKLVLRKSKYSNGTQFQFSGNWHYTDETAVEVPIPNADPSIGDYAPALPPPGSTMPYERLYIGHYGSMSTAERWRRHRGPRALWKSLTSNTPAPLMHFTGHPHAPGTPWKLPQALITRYIRSVYSYYGINGNDENRNISYSTRFELIEKRFNEDGVRQGWTLTLKELTRLGSSACKDRWWTQDFDAVVVATGTFNAPNIPNIPGLIEWRRQYPGSVSHSCEYRYPEKFNNQTMLVVGAAKRHRNIGGPSPARQTKLSLPTAQRQFADPPRVSESSASVQIVPGIKEFHPPNHTIELSDGTFLADVDHILSLPDTNTVSPSFPGTTILPLEYMRTDRRINLSLSLPTARTIVPCTGIFLNLGTITWTMGEYFALAYAKIWSGKAMLPTQAEMWKDHRKEVAPKGGCGKGMLFFNSSGKSLTADTLPALILAIRSSEYTRFFTGWLNSAAVEFGGRQIDGVDPDAHEILVAFMTALFANSNPVKIPFNLSDGLNVADVADVNSDDLWSYLISGS